MRPNVLLALMALLGLLLAAGCGRSPVGVVSPVPTQKMAWIGSYSGTPGPGDMVLDLVQTGSALAGRIVFGSPARYDRVSGAVISDSVYLTLDPRYSSNPSDFSLRAQVLAGGGLSGTMSLGSAGLNGALTCRALARRSIGTDRIHNLPFGVSGIVYDGSRLWLSSPSDYIRLNLDGTLADTIVIYHDPLPAHWVSDAVMYDGTKLWGVFPITIMGPGGSTNVADLLGFTAGGRTPDSLRIGHRPLGLAHDGTHSWSLRSDPPAMIQFDGTGAVTDSLHLGIPDAYRLAFDGAHFWTVGWYLEGLYEVDASGQVLSICDLPSSGLGGLPTGLAAEGSYLWYSEAAIGASVLHRMTIR
jgi:hypothetical protein